MPKPTKGPRLGGSPTHERMILRNLAAQLFEHGRITTTETKAKRLRPFAERLISKAKRGDLHGRRLILREIGKDSVNALYQAVTPALAEREGGYTRITRVGPRKGDNAPMAVIEIITETVEASRSRKSEAAQAKARRQDKDRAKTKAKPAAAPEATPPSARAEAVEEAPEVEAEAEREGGE